MAKVTAARALVSAACIEAMSSKKRGWATTSAVGAIVANAQRLSVDWYLIATGPVGEPALDYEALALKHQATKYEAIGEVYLDHGVAPQPESAPAKAWHRLIGAPVIPYDAVARRGLIESLPNAADVRFHQGRRGRP